MDYFLWKYATWKVVSVNLIPTMTDKNCDPTCLCLFAFWHFVRAPLTRFDALMVRPSPASSLKRFLRPWDFSRFTGGILRCSEMFSAFQFPPLWARILMRRRFWWLDRSLTSLYVVAFPLLIVRLRSALGGLLSGTMRSLIWYGSMITFLIFFSRPLLLVGASWYFNLSFQKISAPVFSSPARRIRSVHGTSVSVADTKKIWIPTRFLLPVTRTSDIFI